MGKAISKIAEEFDAGKIKPDEIWDIETRDLVRIYKNLQRALCENQSLKAKVASLEIQLEFRAKGRAIYG